MSAVEKFRESWLSVGLFSGALGLGELAWRRWAGEVKGGGGVVGGRAGGLGGVRREDIPTHFPGGVGEG